MNKKCPYAQRQGDKHAGLCWGLGFRVWCLGLCPFRVWPLQGTSYCHITIGRRGDCKGIPLRIVGVAGFLVMDCDRDKEVPTLLQLV